MYLSRVKSKGHTYFYAYIYDNSSSNGKRTVYSLGKKESALNKVRAWRDFSNVPNELKELGLIEDKVQDWEKR